MKERDWLMLWTLKGKPTDLSTKMLMTLPTRAFNEMCHRHLMSVPPQVRPYETPMFRNTAAETPRLAIGFNQDIRLGKRYFAQKMTSRYDEAYTITVPSVAAARSIICHYVKTGAWKDRWRWKLWRNLRALWAMLKATKDMLWELGWTLRRSA